MAGDELLFDTRIDGSGFSDGVDDLKKVGDMAKGMLGGIALLFKQYQDDLEKSIMVGADFEAALSRVEAISRATTSEMDELKAAAEKLGASSSFTAVQVVQAMENLASAGFSVSEILQAIDGTIHLAEVSGGDLKGAAETVASAVNAFGLESSEAGHVADIFAEAAARTNAEVLDMGEALKYVAPIAKAMNQSIEETAAAIGIMSDAGIKGTQAGTSLRGALARLAKPTEDMQDLMKDLGLSFYDSEGYMLPISDIVGNLEGGLDGLTQEQRNNALVTLFGQESLSGMLALIEAGPEEIDALKGSLINSAGAAEGMAATIKDNLMGSLEELSGASDSFKLALYNSADKTLIDFVKRSTDYVNRLTEAFNKDGVEGMMKEAGAILQEIIDELLGKGPELATAGADIIKSINTGMSDVLPELTAAGIGIFLSITETIIKQSPELARAGMEALDAILTGITSGDLGPTAQAVMDSMFKTLQDSGPTLLNAGILLLMGILEGLAQTFPELSTSIIDLVAVISETLIRNAPLLLEAGMEILGALGEGLADKPELLTDAGGRIILAILQTLSDKRGDILKAGYEIMLVLLKGIIDNLPLLAANAPEIIKAMLNVFTLNNWANLGHGLMKGFMNGMQGGLQGIGETAKAVVSNVYDVFSTMNPKSAGQALVSGLGEGVISSAGWILTKVSEIGRDILGGFKSVFGEHSPSTVMADEVGAMMGPGVVEGFEDGLPNLKNKTDDELRTLTLKLQTAVSMDQGDAAKLGLDATLAKQARDHEIDKARGIGKYSQRRSPGLVVNTEIDVSSNGAIIGKAETKTEI